jgi:hypothetical protein
MLIFIVVLLSIIPAIAIVYPFFRKYRANELMEDEGSPRAVLLNRWEAALSALKNIELEKGIGTLAEDDYQWLLDQYMFEASAVLKALDLHEQEEHELLEKIDHDLRRVRWREEVSTVHPMPDGERDEEREDA